MPSAAYEPTPLIRGSSIYYALLFNQASERFAVNLLINFNQTLQQIVQKSSEPHIARLKLNWWLEEINFTFGGNTRHPLSQALSLLIKRYSWRQEWFEQMINSMLLEVEKTPFSEPQALLDYCCDNRGAFHLLISNIFSPAQESLQQFAILSGVTCKLIELIRYFGRDYRHGSVFLPQSVLNAHHLTATDLMAENHKNVLITLLRQQGQLAKDTYHQALKSLPLELCAKQFSLLALMNMYLSLLQEIERENFQVFTHKYSLTPLRKWWIAWRTYRHAKRRKLLMIGSAHGKTFS